MHTFETAIPPTIPFHNNINHKRRAKTPSFSSVLLDAIYHSIDDANTDTDSCSSHHNHTTKPDTTSTTNDISDSLDYSCVQPSKEKRSATRSHITTLEDTINLRHATMIDSWIEQPSPPQPNSKPEPQSKACYHHHHQNDNQKYIKLVRQKSVRSRSSYLNFPSSSSSSSSSCFSNATKCESPSKIFNNTKFKALKIYRDLKKSKQQQQPISPSARFTAFLNSIFKNPGGKSPGNSSVKTTSTSTCSSRSCLSKTTTTTDKQNRSVRFYPVNTHIINDDSTKHHTQHNVDDQCKKWKEDKEIDALLTTNKRNRSKSHDYKEVLNFEMNLSEDLMNLDDDDDDDGESCASSDLFELENFNSIGVVNPFCQELPVYGTTCIKNLI